MWNMHRPLVLGLLLLLCAASGVRCTDQVKCEVQEADGSTSTFYPGMFVPKASAWSSNSGGTCPDPFDVPASSKAPYALGTATAAYQVEGAAKEGGREPSIWDTFSHLPGKTYEGQTGDVANDFYHRYPADIELMKSLGVRNFRFSISWPRLFSNGTGDLNPEGVAFYNNLIDALKAACIEPYITLYHWDLPQVLHDRYGGWLDEQIVDDFVTYAEAAFDLFGDRVKHWFTLNEVEVFCHNGYGTGVFAPGRCSDRSKCPEGDSEREPLLCAYHAILAHASAVKSFREMVPDGQIGVTSAMGWAEPLTSNTQDAEAAARLQAFTGGWVMDPVWRGNWPAERKEVQGSALPAFSPEQQQLLLDNKPDFFALQHYTGVYAYYDPSGALLQTGTTVTKDGVELPVADSPWLRVFPSAFRSVLNWIHTRYDGPTIFVTENGVSVPGETTKPVEEVLCDQFRVQYFQQYVGNATAAVQQDGVKLKLYMYWSLVRNFEWGDGFSKDFGAVYVDYATQARYYKASSFWLANWFGTSSITAAAGDASGSGTTPAAAS